MNVLIALFVFTVILGAYFRVRKEKKKAVIRFRALKKITDIRIEEARMQSAREVSGRIGQDLHDEFSASLAGIVRHMELLTHETHDEHIKEHINLLRIEAGKVYDSVRDKSHSLYSGASGRTSGHFDKKIKTVTSFLLPDSLYRKEIDIDKKAADALNVNQRHEILKILQEAATNILKHAKKATEVFVFLYLTENGEIVFQVGDNGSTFTKPADGIGLRSIRKRVLSLKGTFTIETGGGTVLTVMFPGEPQPEFAQ